MSKRSDSRAASLLRLPSAERRDLLEHMSERERHALRSHWRLWAHDGQIAPDGDWLVWLILAGRGFGKTRAGAEWVRTLAETNPQARIALVGASLGEARSVMVEGESGLLAIAPRGLRPKFEPSKRRLSWPGGAQATLYSAGEPESLRGPQHSHAWCDEIAKWDNSGNKATSAWDNLLLGLRLGRFPQVVATTTPRAVALLLRLVAHPEAVISRGRTEDNGRNLPPRFITAMKREFGRTALGRQELGGELLEDIEGALWTRALLEQCREADCSGTGSDPGQRLRTVVAVDPPVTGHGDACGIVVAALYADGIARVLADCSVEKASPERWARKVAATARAWDADRVIAEANQGGDMVTSVLRAAEQVLPVKLVHASNGKSTRAEPVAALYEAGRVRHAGIFARLEDQLCGLMTGGSYQGPGRSPDRADALVWALSELMLSQRGAPRVWIG